MPTSHNSPKTWLIGLVALVMAACGGTAATSTPSAAPTATPAVTPAPTATPAPSLKQVTLRLNFTLTGTQTPFYLAQSKGYYAAAGLDVTIEPGTGSGTTITLVGNGSDTFGFADGATAIINAAKGVPVTTVATMLAESSAGVIAPASSNIKSLTDLEGKTVGVTPGSFLTALWPAVLAKNNIDPSSIKLANVDAAALNQALLGKQVDAILTGIDASVAIEQAGLATSTIKFADVGINTVSLGIIANNSTVQSDPDLVRAFVTASLKAWNDAAADPMSAVLAAQQAQPDVITDATVATNQLKVSLGLTKSPNGADKPLGTCIDSDWANTLSLLKQYQGVTTDQPATAFYTNQFQQ